MAVDTEESSAKAIADGQVAGQPAERAFQAWQRGWSQDLQQRRSSMTTRRCSVALAELKQNSC